ncbi:MAG TPA: TRAP transporter large permease [Clostridia bacterium]|nr:TRAP transporter large permease [Clostridia bacterium]
MTVTILIVFILCMALSFPIAIAMALGALVPQFIDASTITDTIYIIRTMVVGLDSTPILAIPLFILSGALMSRGGISQKLFDVFAYISGTRTAGLPCAVIVTCLFYGAISGSGPATCAAVGSMAVPLLVSLGYDTAFSAAMVTVAGGLGLIIPPSISFINYALVTGTSVTSLFVAGIFPGILIAIFLMGYAYYYCKRNGEDKEKIAINYKKLRERGILGVLRDGFWALLCPVIILGSIYSGICTPTETAALSVIYALLVSVIAYKTLKWNQVWSVVLEAIKAVAPLCVLIAMATALGRILTLANAPQQLATFVESTMQGKVSFLIILNIVLLVLGMFIDGAPAILILSPLLMPVAQVYGIDPVHLGVIIVVNMTIGLASPPFGLNLFVASSISDVPITEIGKKTIPFIIMFVLALVLITFIPGISTILVK